MKQVEKKKFTKEHAREYSLFRVATWYRAMTAELPKIIGESTNESCAVYRGGGLVEIYYEPAGLKRILRATLEICTNEKKTLKKINDFLELFVRLKEYFQAKKRIATIEELKEFQDQYSLLWAYIAVVFMIPALPVNQKLKEMAFAARAKTQAFNETPEIIIEKFLEKRYPSLKKEKIRFILPREIWREQELNNSFLAKLDKRNRGFIFYKNEVFTGNLDKVLDKLGIILEDRESVVSGKTVVNKNELVGQIACRGQASGRVKIISSIKDLGKVKPGDILVAAMTMPKYLPAMKNAAAFVTDEGGLTSHAAIVSREMKKPCIVGTKIATKFFSDGEMVEVDANHGIIKKL